MFSILAFWQGKARDREVENGLRVAIGSGYHGRDREVGNGLRVAIGSGYHGINREVGNGLRVATGGGYHVSFRLCQNAKLL